MRIRTALGALGVSVVMAVAGIVLGAGTASAAVPARGDGHGVSCTGTALGTCTPTLPNGHTLPPCTIAAGATTCSDPFPGGGHGGFGGGNWGGGLGGSFYPGWGSGLNGNLLNLDALGYAGIGTLDVCSYANYDAFSGYLGSRLGGRWNDFRSRFGFNSNPLGVYDQLRLQAACGNSGGTIVLGGSSLSLIGGNLINLDQLGLGAGTVNVCTYPTWDAFSGWAGSRFGSRFNRGRFGGNVIGQWSALRNAASCQQVVVTGASVQAPALSSVDPGDGNPADLGHSTPAVATGSGRSDVLPDTSKDGVPAGDGSLAVLVS